MSRPYSLLRVMRRSGQLPVHDFLAPALFAPSRRHFSVSAKQNATPIQDAPTSSEPQKPKRKPLTKEQRDWLDSAIRVNQAGELAAILIYAAQKPLIVNSHPHLRPLMSHMYDQEMGHFKTFSNAITKHRIRPTALYPLWSVMATGLGWGTAMMGREAAMACTEAVETEIGNHYNGQIRTLLDMFEKWESEGYEVGDDLKQLLQDLRRIRDEELEHLEHAIANDAKKAKPHWLLEGVIRGGCRAAIWMSERV